MDAIWTVLVGNVGSVVMTKDETEARDIFSDYVSFSESGAGRAAGEAVTLFRNSEPVREYLPNDQDDDDQDDDDY